MDRRSQAFGGRWSHLQAFGGICGSLCTWHLLAYVDRHVEAFGGIRGLPIASLWWLTWIAVHKPMVADGVIYKPLVAYMDRRSQAFGGTWSHLQAFGGIRGSPFTSLWWQMELFTSLWWLAWIAVCKPLVAGRVINKPLVAYVDRRSQAFGGRWSLLQAFGCIRGSSCTRFLVAYVDRHVEAFGGIRGLPIASLWWLTYIAVHKPLVADGVIYKPLVAYADRRSQAFGGRWSHLQAFGGIRGSSCTRLLLAYVDRRVEAFGGIRRLYFPSRRWLTWIAVHKPLVADELVYKPLGACVDRRLQACGGRWSY